MQYTIDMKEVPGLEGLYSVTRDGRVFGHFRKAFLKPSYDKNGYARLRLSKNNKKLSLYVHQIVAQTYLPNPENKRYVNHIDNTPGNNALTNLEWCTHKENMEWSVKQGRHADVRGEKDGNAKLTSPQVLKIKALFGTLTHRQLAEIYSVSKQTVDAISTGRLWSHL